MGRAPCCDKANVKKGPWSPEEDSKLKDYIDKHGTGGNWISLPQKAGLKRCGKSCRLRWLNYLRPNIKHGEFSQDEDRIICSLFTTIGSRWSIIAAQLPGRTDNDVKNYWNTKLKKKLMGAVAFSNKRISLHNHDQFPNPTVPYPPLFQTLSNYPFSTYNSPITTTGFDHHHQHQQQPISVQSNLFHGSYVGEEIKGRFLAFGGETSCSSSDGSSSNIQISSSHQEHDPLVGLSFQDYQNLNCGNIYEGLLYPVEKSDDHNHDLLITSGDQKEQTEDYSSLEEIKQLISTNLCNNNNSSSSSFVSQIKTEEELMYYY